MAADQPPYACHSCAAHAAIVFCPVDAARLCLHCDAAVHGASTLAGLHPRARLCDLCGAAPAALRCDAILLALCADCADRRRAPPGTGIAHYIGCPSPTELVRLLSVEAPQAQEEFDAWLADNLAAAGNSGGMCDVAIAAAKIEKLQAETDLLRNTISMPPQMVPSPPQDNKKREARDRAKLRYKEKKKKKMMMMYASRKATTCHDPPQL